MTEKTESRPTLGNPEEIEVNPLGPYRVIQTNAARSLFSLSRQTRFEPDKQAYSDLCEKFVDYLIHTGTLQFEVTGQIVNPDDTAAGIVKRKIPYIHRWTHIYRRSILAKFYQLSDHFKENPAPYTMLTLTTYQAGQYSIKQKGHLVGIEESFEIINEGWRKLRDIIKNRIRKGVSYFWVLEPHKTGYPHIHIILFTEFTDGEKQRITNLWSEKYMAGSAEHGVKFSFEPDKTKIDDIRSYLISYLAGTFVDGDTGSKYEYSSTGRKIKNRWTTSTLLFNTLVWQHGYRMWGASRDLSKVMARVIEDDDGEQIKWFKTMLQYVDNEEIGRVWEMPSPEYEEVVKRHQEYINELNSLNID